MIGLVKVVERKKQLYSSIVYVAELLLSQVKTCDLAVIGLVKVVERKKH